MGDRKMPKVSIILTALLTSLRARLIIDRIKPTPMAIIMMKNKRHGINIICHEGTKPYQNITIVTGSKRIKKSNMACPIEATTKDSFGKFAFVTREPALTRLLVHPVRQVENNCQTEILHNA
ncbi:hypothetical protein JCM12294_32310 [Desulfocicer niacini]